MTDEPSADPGAGDDGLSEVERRRRRARVFGDVLPDRTRDEVDDEQDDRSGGSEEWLRRQRPPHHGG